MENELPIAILSEAGWRKLAESDYADGKYVDVHLPKCGCTRRVWQWRGVYWIFDPKAVDSNTLLKDQAEA
jgi:hypothetical protein